MQLFWVTPHMWIQVTMLWIPYIIFRNTDSDEAVSLDGELRTLVAVTREGEFVRSGPEEADEALNMHELGSNFNIIIFLIIIYNRLKYSKEKKIWSPWTKHMIRNSTALTLSTIIPSILKWTKCIHQNLNWNNNPTILRSAKLTCSWSSSPRLMSWSYLTSWTCWQTPSWLSTLFRHWPWTTMILVHQFKYKV